MRRGCDQVVLYMAQAHGLVMIQVRPRLIHDFCRFVPQSQVHHEPEQRVIFKGFGFFLGHAPALLPQRLAARLRELFKILTVLKGQISFRLHMSLDQLADFLGKPAVSQVDGS